MTGKEAPGQSEDSLDDILSLTEAARICGLAPHTLAQQAEKGRLRAHKVGRTWVTTKQLLDKYMLSYSRQGKGGRT